ncbi:MAG: hypothetical protein ABJG68_09845 [Crocinitomicaceae bacterium]
MALIFLTVSPALSQTEDGKFQLDSATYKRTYNSEWVTVQPFFGYVLPKKKAFHTHFNNEYGVQLMTVGLRLGGPANYQEEMAPISVEYYLPQRWSTADNVDYKLDGFRIGMPIVPIALNTLGTLKQVRYFQYALPVSFNYGIGSLFLNENDLRYRNFFFDFNVSFAPRIVLFDRLVLSSIAEFTWDVTNKQWKSKDETAAFNEGFKRTGISVFFSASWIFLNRSSYVRIYR